MSREIKFRAWDSFSKKFKYGRRVVDHYTNWELSTGLKDKNGKNIYTNIDDLYKERREIMSKELKND